MPQQRDTTPKKLTNQIYIESLKEKTINILIAKYSAAKQQLFGPQIPGKPCMQGGINLTFIFSSSFGYNS